MNKHVRNVFIGEQSFNKIETMYSLRGAVPNNLIQRIHRIAEAGIWEWWMHVLGGQYLQLTSSDEVKAASISANIIICRQLFSFLKAPGLLFHLT